LYIGGAGLARGYRNRPDLSAERFIPDPFTGHSRSTMENRLYRTGDVARRNPDGTVEILGRNDFQVKIRGFRIEPGEIEAALTSHPDIKECIVTPIPSYSGFQLAAYLIFTSGVDSSSIDMRRFLAERLPNYMVPSWFVSLQEFPRTTNGKIDRKALPAPEQTLHEKRLEFAEPSTDNEKKMADLWRSVVRTRQIGIDDNFFEIGGDSMISVQLALRVQRNFEVKMNAVNVFQYPTIRTMIRYVEHAADSEVAIEKIKSRTAQRQAALAYRKKPR